MHLTQKKAQELLPILRHFARTGHLGYDDPRQTLQVGTWVIGVGDTNRGVMGRVIEFNPGYVVVQDNNVSGEEGRYVYVRNHIELHWEPIEPPEQTPSRSRFDRLLEDEP